MDTQKTPISNSRRWYDKKRFVLPALFLFFPLGLALLWMGESFPKGGKIGISIFIGVLFVWVAISPKPDRTTTTTTTSNEEVKEEANSNESSSESSTKKSSKLVAIQEVLKTDYFDITANSVELFYNVNTGNPYASLPKEAGNIYLVINATFKNIDTESRMIMDGSVFINYNGKEYEFDKTESIMAEGWGTMLDQINPLTSKTTNLVWKIPEEINGTVIWKPGRASSGQGIAFDITKN